MRTGVQILDDDVETYRVRIRKMLDEKLIEQGKAARYMCSRRANMGKPPLPVYVIHLEEIIAEWRRRHPKE